MLKLFGNKKKTLQVRLYKVDETAHLWVFGFRDPVNKFQQSIIVAKDAECERIEQLWDKLHERFAEALAG